MMTQAKQKGRWAQIRKQQHAYAFILPTVLAMTLIHFVPMVQGIYMSFLKLNQITLSRYLAAPFIGLRNYADILFNPGSLIRIAGLAQAAKVTMIYATVVTVATIVLGLVVALILNHDFRGRTILRTLFFLPWVIPQFVTGLLWGFMFQKNEGVVNFLFCDLLGLAAEKPFWLIGPNTLWAIIIPTVWRGWPFAMIMLLAGLQQISDDYYQAAKIDGANAWQRFRHITWPLLKPVWATLLLFGMIFNVYSFNIVYMMFGLGAGYPGPWGDLLMTNIFRASFGSYRFGAGAAASVLLMIFMIGMVLIWNHFFKKDLMGEDHN